MEDLIISLKKYKPQKKNKDKIKNKTEPLSNARTSFVGGEIIINAFGNGIFPLPEKSQHEEWSEEKKDVAKEFSKLIFKEEMGINRELFKKIF